MFGLKKGAILAIISLVFIFIFLLISFPKIKILEKENILEGFVESGTMSTETEWASSHITGSVSNPNNALGSTDGLWTTDTGNTNWASRWAMENPSGAIAGTQTITVLARKDSSGGNNPLIKSIDLYENGLFIANIIPATSITSSTGQNVSGTFDASLINNPNDVEIFIDTLGAGGPPSARRAVQINSIMWLANLDVNTCSCPGLNQNWEIDMADSCNINSDCSLGEGNITFAGIGTTKFNATISAKNLEYPSTGQTLYIDQNALVIVG